MNYETLTEIKKEYLELIRIANNKHKLLDSLYYQREIKKIEDEIKNLNKKRRKKND